LCDTAWRYFPYFQLRVPIDIAVRSGNYAAAKILLDARGGAVSVCENSIDIVGMILLFAVVLVPFH